MLLFGSSTLSPWLDQFDPVWGVLDQIDAYLHNQTLGIIEGEVSDGAYLINPHLISIGEGTIVEPGAYIAGPCVIGKGCQIRHGAYIRGGVITGDSVVIGHSTEAKNSIFLDKCCAAHFAYVGDSIIGVGVNLGAGVRCANLRLDKRSVHIDGVDTKRRKVGALIGDGASIGCNTVLNPGTCVAPGLFIPPNQTVKGICHA